VITHIANEGFLIECADKKILVDALFDGEPSTYWYVPPDSVIEKMTQALPPFDHVSLIAVTHVHDDHFNAEIAAAHMIHNPDGMMVCAPQVAEKLAATAYYADFRDRIRTVPAPGDSVVMLAFPGIDLAVLPTRHGGLGVKDEKTGKTVDRHRFTQHLEFLFRIDGWTLFHAGDSPLSALEMYRSLGLDSTRIDVALLEGKAQERMWPERIILMHNVPGGRPVDTAYYAQPGVREVIVAGPPLEKWTFH
jgi:L-ascorbate metabolism protein UlaG (beta-lactamase superfamily)